MRAYAGQIYMKLYIFDLHSWVICKSNLHTSGTWTAYTIDQAVIAASHCKLIINLQWETAITRQLYSVSAHYAEWGSSTVHVYVYIHVYMYIHVSHHLW